MARRAILLVAGIAAMASTARASGLDEMLLRHRCDVMERLDGIRASQDLRNGKDRFIVVSPLIDPGTFSQCIFFDQDRQMICEVASGFYLTKPDQPRVRLVSPAGVEALGRLGFSTDDSKGNFRLEIATPDSKAHTKVADLMISALFVAFGIKSTMPLDFYAPLAGGADGGSGRCRTIG
ncbi:MAG: hypothetical protein ABL907_00875 [Hyphomicrobium sp.]